MNKITNEEAKALEMLKQDFLLMIISTTSPENKMRIKGIVKFLSED
ncbi:MAG: hypothetical protein ACRC2T_01355 [Thermoguttaceae bacterium]